MFSVQVCAALLLFSQLPETAQVSLLSLVGLDAGDRLPVALALVLIARLIHQPKLREAGQPRADSSD